MSVKVRKILGILASEYGRAQTALHFSTPFELLVAVWSSAHHWLIFHGRKYCHARRPLCGECPLGEECGGRARRRSFLL